jgi:hypothetical protein
MSIRHSLLERRSAHRASSEGARRIALVQLAILVPVLVLGSSACVTKFQTGAPLQPEQARVVASDLAVAGVRSRRGDFGGKPLPDVAARLAELTGAPDRSSALGAGDLAALLDSPSAIGESRPRLRELAKRLGHRYALVGEAGTAPTDEQKSWIIEIVVPIPYLWISFGIPVVYARDADVTHSTVSARVVDLERGEVLAASFEVGSDLDPDETPEIGNSAARRAVSRMALERP